MPSPKITYNDEKEREMKYPGMIEINCENRLDIQIVHYSRIRICKSKVTNKIYINIDGFEGNGILSETEYNRILSLFRDSDLEEV